MDRHTPQAKQHAQFEAQMRAMANYQEVIAHQNHVPNKRADSSRDCKRSHSTSSRSKQRCSSNTQPRATQQKPAKHRVRFVPSVESISDKTHKHKPSSAKAKKLTRNRVAQADQHVSGRQGSESWTSKLKVFSRRDASKDDKQKSQEVRVSVSTCVDGQQKKVGLTTKQELIPESQQFQQYYNPTHKSQRGSQYRNTSHERSRPRRNSNQQAPRLVQPDIQSLPTPTSTTWPVSQGNPQPYHQPPHHPYIPAAHPPRPHAQPSPSSIAASSRPTFYADYHPRQEQPSQIYLAHNQPPPITAQASHQRQSQPVHQASAAAQPPPPPPQTSYQQHLPAAPPQAAFPSHQNHHPPPHDPYWQIVPPNPPTPRPGLEQVIAAAMSASTSASQMRPPDLASIQAGISGLGLGKGSDIVECRWVPDEGVGKGSRSSVVGAGQKQNAGMEQEKMGTKDRWGRTYKPKWDEAVKGVVWGYW